jgi:hypothetical protein
MNAPLIAAPIVTIESVEDALTALRALVPQIQALAAEADRAAAFPAEAIALLRGAGVTELLAGEGVAPGRLMEALRLVGRASLGVGRIFEGHVNAARLIRIFGDAGQRKALERDIAAGRLFGVWNTERPPGVTIDAGGVLSGGKCFATGAGHIDRAVITAALPSGERQMVIVNAGDPARADASVWNVRGMKSTVSGLYDLTGLPAGELQRLGAPGDYEREPAFTAGAWRFTAVQLGGIETILILLRHHLAASPAGENAVHRARFAGALAAARSAYLWVREAAARAEAPSAGEADIAFVRMTRGVVERAGLEVMQAAERSVGTQAFFTAHPLDLACRDLSLYLRQPAPDEATELAAAAFIARDCWRDDPLW